MAFLKGTPFSAPSTGYLGQDAKRPDASDSDDSSSEDSEEASTRHFRVCPEVVLSYTAALAACCAAAGLACAVRAVRADNFQAYSVLVQLVAHYSFVPEVWRIGVLAACSLFASSVFYLAGRTRRPGALCFTLAFSALVGLHLLLLAFTCGTALSRSWGPVVQQSNYLCQLLPGRCADSAGPPPASLAEAEEAFAREVIGAKGGEGNASVAGAACRLLRSFCQEPDGFDAETACVCSGHWGDLELQPAGGLEPRRGGAFCGSWSSGEHPWCFVRPGLRCAPASEYVDAGGQALFRSVEGSQGPCSGSVDSRSGAALDGFRLARRAIMCAGFLGLALVSVACASLCSGDCVVACGAPCGVEDGEVEQ